MHYFYVFKWSGRQTRLPLGSPLRYITLYIMYIAYFINRYIGICLAKFPHQDVVNAVAFNPRDPEILVTASDDFTLKIWRSRHRVRQLKLPMSECSVGIEFRRRGSRFS